MTTTPTTTKGTNMTVSLTKAFSADATILLALGGANALHRMPEMRMIVREGGMSLMPTVLRTPQLDTMIHTDAPIIEGVDFPDRPSAMIRSILQDLEPRIWGMPLPGQTLDDFR